MNKPILYLIIAAIALFLIGIYWIEYKPIPSSECQRYAMSNITNDGGLFWGCQYQGCGVGCHYYDKINKNGFRIK